MTIQTEQKPTEHRKANGLHDDVVTLKVDVATLKEQGKNFATKEDIAKLETQMARALAENNENIARLETKMAEARTENKEDINQLLEAINRAARAGDCGSCGSDCLSWRHSGDTHFEMMKPLALWRG